MPGWNGRRFLCALPTLPARVRVFFRHLLIQSWIAFRNWRERCPVTEGAPVFVVGCGHSGTTLLISILNAHPLIRTVEGEANLLHPRHPRSKVARWYEDHEAMLGRGKRLAEKTASNVRYLKRIFSLFPNAQVVVVTRDGRDVACSLRQRTGRLPGAVVRWLYDTKQGLDWVGNERVYQVRYEDLVTDFDKELKGVCGFLGIDFFPELRDFHQADYKYAASNKSGKGAEHNRRREEQARSPLFDGRGKWRQCFSRWELCQVLAAAEPRLKVMVYLSEGAETGLPGEEGQSEFPG